MKSKPAAAPLARRSKTVPPRLAVGDLRLPVGKRCIAKARSGERCKSAPVTGKKKCLFHSGDNARQLGAKGGRRRTVFSPDGLVPFDRPKSAADLRELLAQSIVEIRGGKLDPKLANSISYLGAGFLKALELSDFEDRLAAIEKWRMGEQG